MIRINDSYYIAPDPYCWILRKTGTGKSKKGEEIKTDRVIGYFGTVEGALEASVDEMLKEAVGNTSMDIKTALATLKRLREDVKKQIKGE